MLRTLKNSSTIVASLFFGLRASHARSLAAQKIASLFFGRDGHTYTHTYIYTHKVPKNCLTLGLCLEYETFIRGVFCLTCLCVPLFLKK